MPKKQIVWDYFSSCLDEAGKKRWKCIFCGGIVSEQVRSLRNHFTKNYCQSFTEEAKEAMVKVKNSKREPEVKVPGKKRKLSTDIEDSKANTIDDGAEMSIPNPNYP